MSSKINYNTKAPFQTREDIPDENKVNAEDMNEIKTAVNNNADELDTAKEDIENLQGGQGTSNAEITSLKNRVSTLETDNETNKTNITNLQSNKVDKVEGKGLSTEDFTTELKSKLESLENYDDTEIKEDISNLEAEQIEQNEQIDILLNALPSETAEDENINIKGTIPTKFKEFKLSGNSKQETREGYNLLNVSEELEVSIFKEITVNLKANSTYTLKFENAIAGADNNQSLITFRNTADVISRVIDTSTTKEITVQPEQDITNIRIYASTDYTSSTGKTKTFEKLMLYEGTDDKEYEAYGAMPSPEYPSKIQNVEGNVNVSVCNKNLFGGQWITGLYDVNGNLGNTNGVYKCFRRFLKAGTYSYSYNANIVIARYVNLTKKENLTLSASSFTLDKDSEISLGFRKADSSTWDLGENLADIEFQLQEGSTATDYVEHQEQIVTFPLAEGQKLMKGDYLASDGIHHVRKQMELDGTDFSLYSNQVAGRTIYMISALSNNNNFKTYDSSILCNILKQGTSSNGNNYLNNNGSSGSLYVSIENSILGITDKSTNEEKLQAFQNLIAETGFVYEGELVEEETEAYIEEQQEAYNQISNLKAYEEETNVYSTNSTSPIFKVTAVKSTNAMLTQMKQLILEGGN